MMPTGRDARERAESAELEDSSDGSLAWSRRLQVADDELENCGRIGEHLVTGFNPTSGPFEQFADDFNLEYIDLASITETSPAVDVVLGQERISRSQVVQPAGDRNFSGPPTEELAKAGEQLWQGR